MPGPELNNTHALSCFILTTALQGGYDYCLHFANEDAEAQRDEAPMAQQVAECTFKVEKSASETNYLPGRLD